MANAYAFIVGAKRTALTDYFIGIGASVSRETTIVKSGVASIKGVNLENNSLDSSFRAPIFVNSQRHMAVHVQFRFTTTPTKALDLFRIGDVQSMS